MAYSTPSPPTFPQKAYKGSINDNHFTASTSNLASSVVANTLRTRNKTDQYVAIPCSECHQLGRVKAQPSDIIALYGHVRQLGAE
ncbi:uncharacterized protein EHS24_009389 [Apiotrichum porosum]|uniref:Uncharacterized protein n=1 Tax=Apiotrichum porosum TaxID=105984 RepID=A0A427XLI0_9TREE|nr:uncharacterized protein EHS24_009389 [Apiotrichum porosum]RSH79735.1 hypothetical protein EHS24_009389 [Apiotrichum porosum]